MDFDTGELRVVRNVKRLAEGLEEGIACAFASYCGGASVSVDLGGARKDHEFFHYGFDFGIIVAMPQVGTAY